MPNVSSPLGGFSELETETGTSVRVEVAQSLNLIVRSAGREEQRVELPYPSSGYGGHELLLSSRERFLVMWLFSGQSEVGYELFRLHPVLEHVASFPYVHGEGLGPAFSDDERFLAMAYATNSGLCIDEEAENDGDHTTEPCTLDWLELHVRSLSDGLSDGAAQRCRVQVRLSEGSPCEGDASYYAQQLALSSEDVTFRAEWGAHVRVPLPLPERWIIDGPRTR